MIKILQGEVEASPLDIDQGLHLAPADRMLLTMPTAPIEQRRIELAQQLEAARESAGLSQQQAGELAGVPQRTWSRWESGRASIEAMLGGFEALGYTVEIRISAARDG